jgi:hypothetical protein
MPADADAGIVFGAEDLPDARRRTAERLDLFGDRSEPCRNRRGLFEPAQRIVVAKPERGDPALALILTELKRLQRQRRDMLNEFPLDFRRNEVRQITQPFGRGHCSSKKSKLLGQGAHPSTDMELSLI